MTNFHSKFYEKKTSVALLLSLYSQNLNPDVS